jgi:hypothetical protein
VKSEYMSSIPGYVWPRKPMRAERRLRTAYAASTQSRIASHAGSPSTSVPVTVRYGTRARVNAPASSGTQQAEQFASHSPVVIPS